VTAAQIVDKAPILMGLSL
jgi:hypothetical protein